MTPGTGSRTRIAGVDEAGRGPLAGPVIAAAVILGDSPIAGLDDSKALSAKRREHLFERIFAEAECVAIGIASVAEIDHLNIHHATLLAMKRAVELLAVAPERALVDGKFCPQLTCPAQALIGGDALEAAISAASIVAKVSRDRIMQGLHSHYPLYGFDQHKGYPTRAHLEAIATNGVSVLHRRSFAPVRRLLDETLRA